MILIAIFAILLNIISSDNLLINASYWSKEMHKNCIHRIPQDSLHHESMSSLICGAKISDTNLKENLQRTALIHIFVVSGSHLLLIDQILCTFRFPFFLRIFFLLFYSLCVGWQPPTVRALIALLTRRALQHGRLHFPADLTTLLAGAICLIFFPAWWNSLSFLLSWCAALALCWPSLLRVQDNIKRTLLMHACIFLFMTAPLWGLSSLHPLSLLYNLILAPLVSFILLPLAFASLIAPSMVSIFDTIMQSFSSFLTYVADPITVQKIKTLELPTLWFWIFGWHLLMHFLRLKLWQGRDSA